MWWACAIGMRVEISTVATGVVVVVVVVCGWRGVCGCVEDVWLGRVESGGCRLQESERLTLPLSLALLFLTHPSSEPILVGW